MGFGMWQQQLNFPGIKLTVAVGKKNPIKFGGLQPGFHRSAIPLVFFMPDITYARIFLYQLVRHFRGVVSGAVIHNNDFPLLRYFSQYLYRTRGQLFQIGSLIVSREKY